MHVVLRSKLCGVTHASRGRTGPLVVASAHGRPASQSIKAAKVAASVAASSFLLLGSPAAQAVGIESVDLLPSSIDKPAALSKYAEEQKQKLAQADEAFQNSSTLKELLARSEANQAKNRKDIAGSNPSSENKNCPQGVEGIGRGVDAWNLRAPGGLGAGAAGAWGYEGVGSRLKWLADLLGVQVPEEPSAVAGGKTLKELIYDDDDK
ncbi:hypothetical protein VOLCADRAFT_97584 [Volvox carteri f. nagariensis]|uniref:Uncharacterized protein n=1 Tax=Volvox carteri f. nagariensis TaxID=3068 RepID=D8UD39_VOLCA|nr:uncharacterized protein VOLCADRAFT_97584 [Volvox carteri f. nagariensis]EFJ42327.1 hypothetical protein VOLCADRAFT_97584 [Volvox carteri f. nagariensis]|eukprot:XP_002956560.1 hypothetical protein VOLCADRAFT_97584 [Volvox carteri f. nagariensis]